ncbi:hypothetical protein ACWFPY_27065 [Nocardia fluminea]
MATGGWFNHYDDPDEFWDEEPLTRPQATRNTQTHTPDRPSDSVRGEQAYRSEADTGSRDDRRYQRVDPSVARPVAKDRDSRPGGDSGDYQGSSFATIEVDRGLLPARVELSRQWNRYVNPAEAGDELMRAYKKAVADHVRRSIAAGKLLTGEFRHACPVPDERTVTMLLLEAGSWADYRETQTRIFTRGVFEVHGRALIDNRPIVSMTADCFQVKSMHVWGGWRQQVDPIQIGDEVLFCADHVRSLRPTFKVKGDYSRYSDEDLEYQHIRHRDNLIRELGV